MARNDTAKKHARPSADVLRQRAIPYFAARLPHEKIAALFRVSERTVKRWAHHPDVLAGLGEVVEHVKEKTKADAVELAGLAWETLREVMRDGEDERVRVQAAMTVLDRCGYPVRTETASEVTGASGDAIRVVFSSKDEARRFARGRDGQ